MINKICVSKLYTPSYVVCGSLKLYSMGMKELLKNEIYYRVVLMPNIFYYKTHIIDSI